MKCLLAADSDSVVSGNNDCSGGNGVGLLQRSLGAGAGNGSVCINKNEAKMHIFVFLTVMFALSFSLSAVLILLWYEAVYAFLTHDGLNWSSLLDYLSY